MLGCSALVLASAMGLAVPSLFFSVFVICIFPCYSGLCNGKGLIKRLSSGLLDQKGLKTVVLGQNKPT